MSDKKKPAPTAGSPVLSRRAVIKRAAGAALGAGAAAVLGGVVAAGVAPAPEPIRKPKWIGHC